VLAWHVDAMGQRQGCHLFPSANWFGSNLGHRLHGEVAGIISEEMRAINNEQYKLDKTHRYCIAR